MQFTHVGYGGCWKRGHARQRCNSRTPRLAASQNGFVHSFGTGIGRVTLLQSLIYFLSRPRRCAGSGIRGSSVLTAPRAGDSDVVERLASASATILRISEKPGG